jgi:hypothetical protein
MVHRFVIGYLILIVLGFIVGSVIGGGSPTDHLIHGAIGLIVVMIGVALAARILMITISCSPRLQGSLRRRFAPPTDGDEEAAS